MMNKKAQGREFSTMFAILLFFGLLMVILFVGFIMVLGSAIFDLVTDEIVPEISELGIVGDANMTEIATFTIAPANTFVQQLPWITGMAYIFMIIGCFVFVFIIRENPNKIYIGFFVLMVILLIIACIFMSNIYEDFYYDGSELATRLQEHKILSYMIIFSPHVLSLIAFIAGIIMFSGIKQEVSV